MAVSSAGLRPKSDCSGKAQKPLYKQITDPSSRQRGCHTSRNPQSSDRKQKSGHGSPTPRQTGRLTVGRKLTSTSALSQSWSLCGSKQILQALSGCVRVRARVRERERETKLEGTELLVGVIVRCIRFPMR
jgi:hypothetical protein